MAKTGSSLIAGLARLVKITMVVVFLPLVVGLLLGLLDQLDIVGLSGGTFRQWVTWGFVTYVGIHVLLYRPVLVFRASHGLFSALAVWLFGGQVGSMEPEGGEKGKGGGEKGRAKGAKGGSLAQGSTLVAFSPYVVPLYTILVSAAGWLLTRWVERQWLDGPVGFLLGLTMAFHWLMTADDLQQQRDRWHIETYLLAIELVFVLTLLIGGACLPWAVPDVSFVRALADGLARAQAIYAAIIQRLFL